MKTSIKVERLGKIPQFEGYSYLRKYADCPCKSSHNVFNNNYIDAIKVLNEI